MKAVIGLEIIADNYYAHQRQKKAGKASEWRGERVYEEAMGRDQGRPWVAKLTGLDARYGFAREFLRGQTDYSQANSVGSRGVYEYFILEPGVYEVKERTSWKKTRRFFILVEGETYQEIGREQATALLAGAATV